MIIQEAHRIFKDKYNKLDSNHYRDYTPLQIDDLLFSGMWMFLEKFSFAEDSLQRFDQINSLIVTSPEQPFLTPKKINDSKWEIDMTKLKYPLYRLKRIYVESECGNLNVEIIGHDDLSNVLEDYHRKPSKKWKRVVGSLAKSTTTNKQSLYIYTDKFDIKKVYFEYVRLPKKPFFGGYNSLEFVQCKKEGGSDCSMYYNTATKPVDIDIDERYHRQIIDLAVVETSRILKDTNSLNIFSQKENSIIQ